MVDRVGGGALSAAMIWAGRRQVGIADTEADHVDAPLLDLSL